MTCGCEKPKSKGNKKAFTKAVVEINNPSKITLLRKVVIPASLGDETTIPPAIGEYHNVILYYEASKSVYIYSSDGIPTLVTADLEEIEKDIEELQEGLAQEITDRENADEAIIDDIDGLASDLEEEISDREDADDALQEQIDSNTDSISNLADNLESEIGDRESADTNLQEQIDAISASSDVKDIVGTYQELQNYDTSTLGNNDIIKVLQDETQDDATTYYRWSTSTETFSLIGEEGPYYTKSQTNSLLDGKQNTLVAGSNISITGDVISATDTTYSAGSGLLLNGTTFSADTSILQPKLTAGNNISFSGNTISAIDTTYTAGSGLDLTGTEFSIDNTVALKSDLPTVNDATLTVQKNGTSVGTFTANSDTDTAINITVPTNNSELVNGAGYQTASDVQTAISGKQDILTPGTNISISNNTISAVDTTYSAGNGLYLTGTVFSADTDILQTKLTAGTNITIQNGVISSSGGTYTAGNGLELSNNEFSIDDSIVALKSDIPIVSSASLTIQKNGTDVATFTTDDPTPVTANITVPTDTSELTNGAGYQTASGVQSLIAGKQDILTAGNNIQINNNTISATDTTYTGGTGIYVTGTVISADTDVLQTKLTAGNNITISSGTISATDTTYSDFTGADASTAGTHGLVPAPIAGDQNKFLRGDGTWANDNTELVEMAYGESNAWAKFIAAYTNKKIVYCRASSNSNPGSGAKTRKAFMAYVNDETTPTSVEFQYVRSVSSKSDSQQCDQVFVYTLTSTNGGTWSVTTRNMATTVNVDSSLTKTYTGGANATMTLKANAMTGATSSVAGTAGYVPAPAAGDDEKFLAGDGTWQTVSVTPYVLPIATTSTLGGIKVGSGLSIDNSGVLSASSGSNILAISVTEDPQNPGTFIWSGATLAQLETAVNAGKTIFVNDASANYNPLAVTNAGFYGSEQEPEAQLFINNGSDITVYHLYYDNMADIDEFSCITSNNLASTSTYGITKLSTSTSSTSVSLAATPSAVKAAYDLANSKQDALTAGTNITISGTTISATDTTYTAGTGLDLTGTQFSIDNTVALKSEIPTATSDLNNDSGFITKSVNDLTNYTPTSNLATVATSGSYNDLSNKPTIPAAQVNSDWNASSGVAQILNKPSLATVATTGAYSDLSGTPTIPTVNDATLTITQNGTSAGTFTANASSNTTIALTDTTYSAFTGTDGTSAGAAGLVPAPATTDAGKFLKADGTWATAGGSNIDVFTTNEWNALWA